MASPFLFDMAILIAGIHFPEKNAPTRSTVAAPFAVVRLLRATKFYGGHPTSITCARLPAHPHARRRAAA